METTNDRELIFIEVPEDYYGCSIRESLLGKSIEIEILYGKSGTIGIEFTFPKGDYTELGTVTLTECSFDVEPYTDVVKYEGNIHQYKELCENQFRNKIEKELGKSFTNPLGEEWPSMPNAYLESGKEQEEVWTKIKEWQSAERNKLKKVVVLKKTNES